MAATLDLRSSAVRREGSTPSPGTKFNNDFKSRPANGGTGLSCYSASARTSGAWLLKSMSAICLLSSSACLVISISSSYTFWAP
jgi:hypothetical protein